MELLELQLRLKRSADFSLFTSGGSWYTSHPRATRYTRFDPQISYPALRYKIIYSSGTKSYIHPRFLSFFLQRILLFLQEYVCGPKNVPCSWGRATNVANRYVYVSQPEKNRVLVISEVQMMIIDVRVLFLLLLSITPT